MRTITVKAEAGYNETTGEAFNCTQVNIATIALLEGYKPANMSLHIRRKPL
ncbi:hypothetical protein [Colwellia sp. C1TZA3]|uniref:hypothetical protein n=1 Tax=Colwellia sp. C1TZA3 TaxID=2508879 RepID=UPI001CB8D5A8|nr:hypothetical protein [Colwellia sp. C1TZA3]